VGDLLDLLIERDAERAVLGDALAAACEGRGSAVLLEGEAGIGKTSLLAAACAAARGSGPRLMRARGTPLEQGVAYGVARQLLIPALDDPERLLKGVASHARSALLVGDADEPAAPEAAFAVREGLTWLVAAMAEDGGPLALIVDDLHWADTASARFLHALAGRIDDLPVVVLMAARPSPAWSDPGLAAALGGSVRVLRPARLSSQGVSTALARRLHAQPADEFAGAAHAQTAGTPYLVAALADALQRESVEPTADGVDAIGRLGVVEVGRDVAARVSRLDADARAIGRAAAILGDGRSATEAERLAGVEAGTAARVLAALEAAGLVRGWPDLHFDHPLVRAAILDDLGAEARSQLHERAAELAMSAGEAERAAAHLAEVPGRGIPERVEVLHRVGRRALQSGAPDVAVRHLRRALDEPPLDAARGPLLFDLGMCELSLGDPAATDRLSAAADATASPDMRLRARMISGHALTFMGRWAEAFDRMGAAIAGGALASPADLVLARIESAAALLTCIPTGREAFTQLNELEREILPGDPMRPLLEGVLALLNVTAAYPRDDQLRRIRLAEAGAVPEHAGTPASWTPLIALVLADAFSQSQAALDVAVAGSRSRLDLTTLRILSAWLALNHVRRGRLVEAEQAVLAVNEGEGPAPSLAEVVATIVHASLALERGDLAAAAAWADRPLERDPRVAETNFFDGHLVMRGRVRLAQGYAADAYAMFAEAGRRQTQWGGESPPITQWRTYLAATANVLGRTDEARDLIDEEVAVAERFGAARPLAAALRTRAAIVHEDAERHLRDAMDVLDGSLAELEQAYVGADLGDLLLREQRADASRAVLLPALELAWAGGADALAERIRASLVKAGARPRRPQLTGVRALTPAEARTARMAAEGVTNRELAETLFVTEKTVETHLTAAYRKLNIAGRAQLGAALGTSQGVPAEKTGVHAGGGRT
jgi:DNA-binding CsgD family transcriptional regulator